MASTTYVSYHVYPGDSSGVRTFGYLTAARKFAKTKANETGISSIIYSSGGKRTKTYHVRPDKKRNPSYSIPTDRWLTAEVRKIGRKLHINILGPKPKRRRR